MHVFLVYQTSLLTTCNRLVVKKSGLFVDDKLTKARYEYRDLLQHAPRFCSCIFSYYLPPCIQSYSVVIPTNPACANIQFIAKETLAIETTNLKL